MTAGAKTIGASAPSIVYRGLLTVVTLDTCFRAFAADWNETHIYNPRWPPHAKIHNGQIMSMDLALGVATLYYLWRPVTAANAKDNRITIVIFSSLYWVTQITATLFPAIRLMDP
jgi:hypothetical protein